MRITYLPIEGILEGKPLSEGGKNLSFLVRSVLGKELRMLSCTLPRQSCNKCLIAAHCVYAQVFESLLEKESAVLPGRDRASHPFTLFAEEREEGIAVSLILIGRAIDLLPHFYLALVRGGERGIGKERTAYRLVSFLSEGHTLRRRSGSLLYRPFIKEWYFPPTQDNETEGMVTIEFLTPLRLKKRGALVHRFTYEELVEAIARRVSLLSALYGEGAPVTLPLLPPKQVESHLGWLEQKRYSARQRSEMLLGGVVGTMKVQGSFLPIERSLLEAGVLFGVGKNTSFGLGRIKVTWDTPS